MMTDFPCHKSISLQNFTVFKDLKLKFSPGINVFVGENGTGKTHLLKALYGFQRNASRPEMSLSETYQELFQTKNSSELIRLESDRNSKAEMSGEYGVVKWDYRISPLSQREISSSDSGYGGGSSAAVGIGVGAVSAHEDLAVSKEKVSRPVFIPALDMMAHTRGFLQANSEVVLDFDLTCIDIVTLFTLERRNGKKQTGALKGVSDVLGGKLDYSQDSGRFYLVTEAGRIPMPLVAEGIRKIAAFCRLYQNGWLPPGTSLFWDEPEVNLNPSLMDEVISSILELARSGVQVFLATHSYVILRELEVQSRKSDALRYFAFAKTESGVTVQFAERYLDLDPNLIERQYASLYDRGIEKRLRGE